jgi:glycosyltransferase involved in cell wall biosynthesis
MSFIAWVPEGSRAGSISRALGGEWRAFYDLRIQRTALVPLRYVLSALRTICYLLRRWPRAVIVQAPPVPAAALVLTWARVARAPVVIDTHPASFGLDGHPSHRAMRPLLASLVPRAAGCIVTTPQLGEQISRWNGRPLIVHEAPMVWSEQAQLRECSCDNRLLFVCTFAPDEPLMEVLEAARRLPAIRFQITGDLRRLPADARRTSPRNVEWVGYLGPDEYVAALNKADVVMTLTRRAESVPRSAHEAVDALRPLVLSDWPHVSELFPYAVLVDNDGRSIAAGIEEAFRRRDELSSLACEARAVQHRRWRDQLGQLRAALGLAGSGG